MRNPYINLLTQSWHFAQEKRMPFIVAIVFFIIANSLLLLQPYIFGQLVNSLQIGWPTIWQNIVFYTSLYCIIPFFFWVFHGSGRIIEISTAFYIAKNFKSSIFSRITELPFSWHADNHSGEIINKVSKATNAIEKFSSEHFMYIQAIIRFFGSLVGILYISWYLGILAGFFGIVIIMIILRFDKKLIPQYATIYIQEHKVASLLHDYISNIRTVITLHFEKLAQKELIAKIQAIFPIKRANIVLNEFKWFSTSMCIAILFFGIILSYAYFELKVAGVILAWNLVILYQYLDSFSNSFYSFASSYEDLVKMNSEFQTIDIIQQQHKALSNNFHHTPIQNWKTIELKNWNFSYESSKQAYTLSDIHIELHKWTRIALIGESGSGKSTLASLIKWLYTADTWTLSIDDRSYDDLGILSTITTFIPQDPEIFENTLQYNITFGIDGSPEDIMRAVQLSRFDIVLKKLPNGLETNIKEKWVNLSGGEKQRLALARGIFMAKDNDIIIMDEPTSSIDPANELAIYENIFQEYPEKCIISAIHRIHLLPLFDIIYVFDRGKIIESGSLEELIQRKWKFFDLWEKYTKTHNKNIHL